MIYQALKTVINGGNYDYEQTLSKMDLFLLGNRINEAQYTELKELMDSKKEQQAQ